MKEFAGITSDMAAWWSCQLLSSSRTFWTPSARKRWPGHTHVRCSRHPGDLVYTESRVLPPLPVHSRYLCLDSLWWSLFCINTSRKLFFDPSSETQSANQLEVRGSDGNPALWAEPEDSAPVVSLTQTHSVCCNLWIQETKNSVCPPGSPDIREVEGAGAEDGNHLSSTRVRPASLSDTLY